MRFEMVERLNRDRLLPAIDFVFSRVGCDAAVDQCPAAGLRLTSNEERMRIREIVEDAAADLPAGGPRRPGLPRLARRLERGFAAHHAGTDVQGETVEALFQQGPGQDGLRDRDPRARHQHAGAHGRARKLVKWNGGAHADVTPGVHLAHRSRGAPRIDVEGNAVVVWHQGFDPGRALAGLASTRTYPLRSSFKPSYNMAVVNLVGILVGPPRRRASLLETSFAQFQADPPSSALARQVRKQEGALGGLPRGDEPPRRLRGVRRAAPSAHRREKELARGAAASPAAAASLEALKPGRRHLVPPAALRRRSRARPRLHRRDEPRPSGPH